MKKLLAVVAASLAGAAFAGDYHVESTLRCSECHTMHASRTHGLNQAAFEADFFNTGVMAAPNRNLLIKDGTNATCLACHDATSNPAVAGVAPDVLGENSSTLANATGSVRSAGALNARAAMGLPSPAARYAEHDGHTLGSDAIPPGFVGVYEPSPQENFNCANCHAVHGSLAFRNLGLSRFMGLPGQSGTAGNPFATVGPAYNILTDSSNPAAGRAGAQTTHDVYVTAATARTYQTGDVVFHEGTGGMNAYCAGCHGYFHGDGNTRDLIGGIDFVRHPTTGVDRDVAIIPLLNFGTQTAQLNLVRPAWAGTGATPAINTVGFEAACLSCHKGHGNSNGYGLIYPNNAAANTNLEEGDAAPADGASANGVVRNLCVTCHAQGRDLDDPSVR